MRRQRLFPLALFLAGGRRWPWTAILPIVLLAATVPLGAGLPAAARIAFALLFGLLSLLAILSRECMHRLQLSVAQCAWLPEFKALDWRDYLHGVGDLFRLHGYTMESCGPSPGEDHYVAGKGGRKILIRCHLLKGSCGIRAARELADAMRDRGLEYGYLVNPGGFDAEVRGFAGERSIALLDGAALVRLVHHAGAGGALLGFPPAVLRPPPCPHCGGGMRLSREKGRRPLWKCRNARVCTGSRELSPFDREVLRHAVDADSSGTATASKS